MKQSMKKITKNEKKNILIDELSIKVTLTYFSFKIFRKIKKEKSENHSYLIFLVKFRVLTLRGLIISADQ